MSVVLQHRMYTLVLYSFCTVTLCKIWLLNFLSEGVKAKEINLMALFDRQGVTEMTCPG